MFLSWIPVIGPIIDGVFSFLNKKEDTAVVRIQTEGKTKEAKIVSESLELQARTQLAIAMKDDIGTRLGRDLIMFPVSMWVFFKLWYALINGLAPELTWVVLDIPKNIEYIPYAVIAYLFVMVLKR